MTYPDMPGPAVVIGLKEIYDQLVALNTKVEVLIGDVADQDTKVADHETRLRSLERARWPLPTLAVLVALASAAIAAITLLTR